MFGTAQILRSLKTYSSIEIEEELEQLFNP